LSNLAAALIKFHEAVPTIHDNAESYHGGFANLPGVLSNIGPALRANGLVVSQLPEDINGQPGLRTTLMHTSGEHLSAVTPLSINSGKNGTQEWGKAVTYSRRYGLLSVLGLCVGIIDNDGDLDADAKSAAKVEHQQTKTIPGIPPEEMKLKTPELNALINEMKKLSDGKKEKLATSFCVAFKLGDQKLSRDTISRRKHQTWIQEWLKAHA
tara:strand:+ start:247 stop:879 length:633 start_codon:yes stop_codon:yes gene_type:complete